MIANTLKVVAFLFTGVVIASALASDSAPPTTQVSDTVKPETTQALETEKTEAQLDAEFEDLKQKQEAVKDQLEHALVEEPSQNNSHETPRVAPVAQKLKPESEPVRSSCHPNYSGCLNPNAGDYDCVGGSGNGPNYTGPVEVYGADPFDLDRDHDGRGCDN